MFAAISKMKSYSLVVEGLTVMQNEAQNREFAFGKQFPINNNNPTLSYLAN